MIGNVIDPGSILETRNKQRLERNANEQSA
jgi:hypothetical protein